LGGPLTGGGTGGGGFGVDNGPPDLGGGGGKGPLPRWGEIPSSVTATAHQAIVRNAKDTAWEAVSVIRGVVSNTEPPNPPVGFIWIRPIT